MAYRIYVQPDSLEVLASGEPVVGEKPEEVSHFIRAFNMEYIFVAWIDGTVEVGTVIYKAKAELVEKIPMLILPQVSLSSWSLYWGM